MQSLSQRRFFDVRPLGLIVALFVLGDLATTVGGLSMGIQEQNPVVAALIEGHGMAGLVVVKTLLLVGVALICKRSGPKHGKAALLGLFIPHFFAVGLNLLTIAQA